MLRHKPKRKLLLPAGIISLSLLSFLCIEFIHQQLVEKNSLGILEFVAWDPRDRDQINPNNYVTEKFTKIKLTGSDEDKDKLRLAKKAIHELLQKKDATLGLEFTFGPHAKYASLAELCSLCEVESVPSYYCRGNKFWILNIDPQPRRFQCGTYCTGPIVIREKTPYNFKWVLSTHFTWCLALSFLFLMLIVAAARKTIKSQPK